MSLESLFAMGARMIGRLSQIEIGRPAERARISETVRSLRQVFFMSEELVSLLQSLAGGEDIDQETAIYYAKEFEYVPTDLVEALKYLEAKRFEGNHLLLIDDLEMMASLRNKKERLRTDIHRIFLQYANHGHGASGSGRRDRPVAEQAAAILGQREFFNLSAKKLELRLLRARKTPAYTGGSGEPKASAPRKTKRSVNPTSG